MTTFLNYLYFSAINLLAMFTVIERGLGEDASPLEAEGDKNLTAEICKRKDFLTNCLSQLPSILKNTEHGLPASKEDVDAVCKGFKLGMSCIHEYAEICFTNDQKQYIANSVQGARHTFKFLCDDPGFKAEYLRYTTCLRGIRREWDDCANRFIALVKEELSTEKNASSRFIELCCARYGFINCVRVSTRLKCRKEEITFITKIADALSNMRVYGPHCNKLNYTSICSSARAKYSSISIFCVVLIFFDVYLYIL